MNIAWAWILLGGILETVWAMALKLSDGFTVVLYDAVFVIALVLSVLALNRGLKSGLPMGVCYSVWVGIGAIGSVIAGMLFFGETLNLLGFLFLAMVIGGVLGLNLTSEPEQ